MTLYSVAEAEEIHLNAAYPFWLIASNHSNDCTRMTLTYSHKLIFSVTTT